MLARPLWERRPPLGAEGGHRSPAAGGTEGPIPAAPASFQARWRPKTAAERGRNH
jgi:hypothetical protein